MRQIAKTNRLRRKLRFAVGVIGLLHALILTGTGCNSTKPTHSGDPLFGEYYPKGPTGQQLPQQAAANQNKVGLSTPTALTGNSPAAFANNTALPGASPLAIGEKNAPDWTLTNTNKGGNPTAAPMGSGSNGPTGSPKVMPVPRDPTGNPGASSMAPAPGGILTTGSWSAEENKANVPPLGAESVEVLQSTLQARGVLGLKTEPVPEGVRVSCFAPQPDNPANLRYLETTAPDVATALQALRQKLDSGQ
ncbi:MAG: hypothetical protein L0Y72_05690 [Gemmataceae bacterium]|nr:hypothetical protein [Gemmataceae bacterium]MCI0738517.1 hypothetical protein [Gemmataceae bacterium]